MCAYGAADRSAVEEGRDVRIATGGHNYIGYNFIGIYYIDEMFALQQDLLKSSIKEFRNEMFSTSDIKEFKAVEAVRLNTCQPM